MGSDEWPDWLPGDWSILIRKVDKKKVKCYIGPDGHKCYSKPQLFEYLKRTNKSIPDDNTEDADGQGIDLSAEPNAFQTDEVPGSSPGGHPAKLTPRTNRRKSITADLSEDFLAGDGSSTDPLSHKRHRGDCSWLPAGWTVEDKFRKGGNSTGMKYKVYKDPVSGQKFFSKPQVLNYLARINSSAGGQEAVFAEPISALPISAWQEKPATEPDSSQYEDTEVEKNTEEKTKSPRLSSGYEVISRTPAEGLPPDWIKEVRMKKSGSTTRKDTYYLDPLSEYAFCSKKDVLRYLESGDVKNCVSRPLKSHTNNGDTINVNMTPQSDQSKGTEASKEFTNGSVEEMKTNEIGIENPEPLRSITGGSLSRPDRRLFVARKEDADWLPDGWLIDVRYKSSGMKYKIYKDPATGKLFYSKPQVLSYLENGGISNPRKRKAHDSSVAPDSSPNSTPADGSGPKKSGRKKGKSENSEYQEVITTSAANGLPPGWIKETKTKIYATHTRNDQFYTDPVTGYIFRSKVDALRFVETGDVSSCSSRPKVKDEDGKEAFVYTSGVQKPTTGDNVVTEVSEEFHTPDPKAADNTNHRATNNNSTATDSPARSSKRQETGVNLEKEPDDDGNLPFDMPVDDNWTDQYFEVKSLANEIMFNGQPISGGFQEDNAGVEATGVKDTTPTKVV